MRLKLNKTSQSRLQHTFVCRFVTFVLSNSRLVDLWEIPSSFLIHWTKSFIILMFRIDGLNFFVAVGER